MLCRQVLSPGVSYDPLPQVRFKHVKASFPGQYSMCFVCCRRKEHESVDANLSRSIAAFSAPGRLCSLTGLLVKLCRASRRWTKPFGKHGQVGTDLLVERCVKTGNEGLLISGNRCFSHVGNSCSSAGLQMTEGIEVCGPAKAKG